MDSQRIIIRNVKRSDFDSVYPLFSQLWPDKKLNKSSLKKVFLKSIKSDSDKYFCAAIDNKITGFCSITIKNSLWQEGKIANICELIVDEKHRGKKIGTSLMKHAEQEAKKAGCKAIELDSAYHRKLAHKFYKKIGYEDRAYLFSKVL